MKATQMQDEDTKEPHSLKALLLALTCSIALAVFVGACAFFWDELEQTKRDNAALADQVRQLGGQPVAEGKAGERGDRGPQGPPGPTGPQGPVGPAGPRGPIGVTGQSPACLLEPTRCVGPKGSAGAKGTDGADGADGETGPQGPQGDPGATGPQGPQGPAGPAGPTGPAGEQGATGATGETGRGVTKVECQADGTWLITYTDGTTSTTGGPCRVVPEVKIGN